MARKVAMTFAVAIVSIAVFVLATDNVIYRSFRASTFSCRSRMAIRAKSRGESICEALERFRVRNGKFPNSLTDLVPKELREVPEPGYGDPTWRYLVAVDRNSFSLSFGIDNFYPCCVRDSETSRWHEDR